MIQPLTRAEAAARGDMLRVHAYDVYLDLGQAVGSSSDPGFWSRTRIRFSCRRPGAGTWVDVVARAVRRATLNGTELAVGDAEVTGRLRLPELAADNELVLDGDFAFSDSSQGLHHFTDPADHSVYVYSHLQSAHACRVFACFDQPDLKASFTVMVRSPREWTVLANSPVARERPGEPGSATAWRQFAPTPRMSTYLLALAGGPLASWTPGGDAGKAAGGQRQIPLGIHARRSMAGHVDPEPLLAYLRDGITFYSDAFGVPYPFGKLDLCFVPEFSFGAMENAALITAAESFVFDHAVTRWAHQRRCEMVLHELVHQWFGNLVTPRWWDDLWLSEAFATWAAIHAQTRITEFADAWAGFCATKKALAYAADLSPAAHPVVCDVPDTAAVVAAFDVLTYHKGASVLRQLAARLGTDHFIAGVGRYLAAHAHGCADRSDLLRMLCSGVDADLGEWSRQWLLTSGVPVIRADFAVDDAGRFSRFAILQDQPGPQDQARPHDQPGKQQATAPPSHRLGIGVYSPGPGGCLERTTYHELDVSGWRTEVPEMISREAGPLVLLNDGDLAYCRVALDTRSADTVAEQVGAIADPLARTVCWVTAWEMLRAGDLAPRQFLAMTTRFLPSETETGIVIRLLNQAATLLGTYTDQDWSIRVGWPSFVGSLLGALASPTADRDRQLAFARAIAAAVLTADQLSTIRRWLDGDTPPGLRVDKDLRWRLARALIAHGAAPATLADDLARADPTASGRRWADQLRASEPVGEAKEQAWQAMLDPSVPPAQATALAAGFAHPAQHELLAPFASRYVRDIGLIWQRGPAEVSARLAAQLFPSWCVARGTLEATGWLLEADVPPPLLGPVGIGHAELAIAVNLTDRDIAASGTRPVSPA